MTSLPDLIFPVFLIGTLLVGWKQFTRECGQAVALLLCGIFGAHALTGVELLSTHVIDVFRIKLLLVDDTMLVPHRLLLLLIAVPGVWFLALDGRPAVRRWLVCWATIST